MMKAENHSIRRRSPCIDEVMVRERCAALARRSLKKESKIQGLKLAISMMDLTTLEGQDTPGKIVHLCRKALRPFPEVPDIPSCAAVCVYPNLIRHAKKQLEGSRVKVAAVATGFPSGQFPLRVKLADVRAALSEGADEIDMVIDRGAWLRGDHDRVADEITAIKKTCGKAHLKVILETGELGSLDAVRHASDVAMEAGADFIKTSTGKISPAATPEVTLVMLEAIRDHFDRTGRRVGMKPAGGIRTSKQALAWLVMLQETLGSHWMTPDLFRFGASTLLNDVLMQIGKELSGCYQSAEDYSLP